MITFSLHVNEIKKSEHSHRVVYTFYP